MLKLPVKATGHSEALIELFKLNPQILSHNLGVEVGVRHGENAFKLLSEFKSLELLAVDPYLPYMDVNDDYFDAERQNKIMQGCKKALSPFELRVSFFRETSVKASQVLLSSLDETWTPDFVFIDADHSFAAAYADAHSWWEVVRKGGVLCGHDYSMPEVARAVHKFVTERELVLQVIPLPSDIWIVSK